MPFSYTLQHVDLFSFLPFFSVGDKKKLGGSLPFVSISR